MYRKTQRDVGSFFFWEEQHLYGSSRLGIERAEQSIRGVVSTSELSNEVFLAHEKWGTEWWTNLKQQYVDAGKDLTQTLYESWGDNWEYRMNLITTAQEPSGNGFLLSRVANESAPIILGKKQYELSNHLGNVLAVVSDKKLYDQKGNWTAQVLTAQDYYPFGMTMGGTNGRSYTAGEKYRYSFNGKEDDTESGIQDYGMRMYDKSLGRFLSVDPLTAKYPWYTPYQFAGNMPIRYIDLDGLEPCEPSKQTGQSEVAREKGTNDYYNYTANGRGGWLRGGCTDYSRGNVNRPINPSNPSDAKNDDVTSTYYPGVKVVDIPIRPGRETYIDNDLNSRLSDFTTMFKAGIFASYRSSYLEGLRLKDHFIQGSGTSILFNTQSQMSRILSEDPAFIEVAATFETKAYAYYDEHQTMEGFDGNKTLNEICSPYIKNTLFMYTVLGGIKEFRAQIRVVSSTELQVRYTVWDTFGADQLDAAKSLPGLPSLYWLQHNAAYYYPKEAAGKFKAFNWGIEVDR